MQRMRSCFQKYVKWLISAFCRCSGSFDLYFATFRNQEFKFAMLSSPLHIASKLMMALLKFPITYAKYPTPKISRKIIRVYSLALVAT